MARKEPRKKGWNYDLYSRTRESRRDKRERLENLWKLL